MKSISLAVLATLLSVSSFAEQKSPARMAFFCAVKQNESVLAPKVWSEDFFKWVSDASRRESPSRCIIGKIYDVSSSSRIYFDGRNLTQGQSITAREVREVERLNGLRPYECATVSCIPTNNPF